MERKEDMESSERKGRDKAKPEPSYIGNLFVTAPPDYPSRWMQMSSFPPFTDL